MTDISRDNKGLADYMATLTFTSALPAGSATAALQSAPQGSPTGGAAATASILSGGVYNLTKPSLTDGQQAALQLGSRGGLVVTGGVASGATDSGDPIKFGGVYNTTLPVLTTGQRGDAQLDASSNLRTKLVVANTSDADGATNSVGFAVSDSSATAARSLSVYTHYLNGSSLWDRTRGDTNGALTQPHALTGSRWQYAAASGGISNTTAAVTFIAAAGASVRNYVTAIQVEWEALTNAGELAIRDGAGGTVLWRSKIPSGAAGRRDIAFAAPLKGTANTLMEVVTLTASGAGAVYFNAQGFQGT